MICAEFEARLHPYVDGELGVDDTARGDAHVAECRRCAALVDRERELRRLLRRQPREAAPAELRERIVAGVRRAGRRRALRPWLLVPAVAAAAALSVLALFPVSRPTAPLVADLVDKHIAYAQVDRPAELTSASAEEIRDWFRRRANLKVTVPDFTPAGIQLVGARLADAHERRAAYLLYRKGMTLMSVFMVPVSARDDALAGRPATYRGHEYLTSDWKGHRTVSWTDGQTLFGLVSMLDYEALLECADRLRADRTADQRL